MTHFCVFISEGVEIVERRGIAFSLVDETFASFDSEISIGPTEIVLSPWIDSKSQE